MWKSKTWSPNMKPLHTLLKGLDFSRFSFKENDPTITSIIQRMQKIKECGKDCDDQTKWH